MRVLIVHAHPEPASFNAALTDTAVQTLQRAVHEVEVSDLYAAGFDPVERGDHYLHRAEETCFSALAEQRHASEIAALPADIRREINRLEWADLVILQFPLWWHGPPAMLKGWFDRVFVSGGLYTSTMRYDRGYFRGKQVILSVTTGAPASAFGPGARGGDIGHLLWPVHYSLHYVGFSVLPPFVAFGIQGHGYAYQSDDCFARELASVKSRWAARLERHDDMPALTFPGWSDWDETGAAKPDIAGPDLGIGCG